MIAAEFKNTVSTVRIHDEYCESSVDRYISHLGQIVSNSYKRRQLSSEAGKSIDSIAAVNIKGHNVKS